MGWTTIGLGMMILMKRRVGEMMMERWVQVVGWNLAPTQPSAMTRWKKHDSDYRVGTVTLRPLTVEGDNIYTAGPDEEWFSDSVAFQKMGGVFAK